MKSDLLEGKRIFFFGKLAGLSRVDLKSLVHKLGGTVARTLGPTVNLVVVGEADLLASDYSFWIRQLGEETRTAFEAGTLKILAESAFWKLISGSFDEKSTPPLFTPAMIADLTGLPVATIRLWQRRGLIVPVKFVHNLAYFDFQEVLTAQTLRELLKSGLSVHLLEQRFRAVERLFSGDARPLAQLFAFIEGKDVLLRQGNVLIDQRGQRRMDFAALEPQEEVSEPGLKDVFSEWEEEERFGEEEKTEKRMLHCLEAAINANGPDVSLICEEALALEEAGEFESALSLYRTAIGIDGPDPELCFHVAELLAQLKDYHAARERYYMVLELNENHIEARAKLGCVLAELGNGDLAVHAFLGALKQHPDYADVHFYLGRLFFQQGKKEKALPHFQAFLKLCPESPWTDEVQEMLQN